MTDNPILSLYCYNTWANATVSDHLQKLPAGVERVPVKSVFPSIFATLMHVYIVDRGWYSLLNNECRSDDYDTIGVTVNRLMADIKNDSLPVLEHKQKLFAVRFRDFILEKDMRHEEVFGEVKMSYADVITHVVNHVTYHRGNITAMLHQLGHKGVPTDYGRYLYEIAL